MAATCYCKIKFFHNGLLSAKLYQQANPQGAQGAAPQGDPQQGTQGGSNGDPNVYDADFKDVDGN